MCVCICRCVRNHVCVCVCVCLHVCMHACAYECLDMLGLSSVHSEAAQKTETGDSLGRTGASHSALSLAAFPLARLMLLLQLLLDNYRQLMETFRVVIKGVRTESQILGFHPMRFSITLDTLFLQLQGSTKHSEFAVLLSVFCIHACISSYFFKL